MLHVRLASGHLYGKQLFVHLTVAGGVFDGVFLCFPFSPLDVLDEIWDVIESVSEGFLTYCFLSTLGAFTRTSLHHLDQSKIS